MTKDTQKIVIITGAIALGGVILYFVLGTPQTSTGPLTYTSGSAQTTPATSTTATNAAVTEAQKAIDKLFGL